MRIVNLASGSKGNSTLLEYGGTKVLIDVGLSEKKLKTLLQEVGVKGFEEIYAICITHEHVDHIKALFSLAKKYDIKVFVHQKLAESSVFEKESIKEGNLHTFTDMKFNVGDFEFLPVGISHDAIAPVGFVVNVFASKSRVGFLTDTGVVFDSVKRAYEGVKMIFLESNFDKEMLFGGKYPEITKKRIFSDKGHLSNEQSLAFAKYLYDNGTRCFILSHISENNNTHELAYVNYVDFFESQGAVLDKDVFVRLSFQNKHGNNFNLKEEF